jgi:hypothetical protein
VNREKDDVVSTLNDELAKLKQELFKIEVVNQSL